MTSKALCIRKQVLLKAYRCIIPLLWEQKKEWILLIIDQLANSVYSIYPKYTADVMQQASSGDERVSHSIVLKDKLSVILSASRTQPQEGNNLQQMQVTPDWQFYCIYNATGTNDILKDNINHRTPAGMDNGVLQHNDSGIYILHAMECDYYDCPIFNTIAEDWNIIRMKIGHCILNKQLII
jgi:hypothetical protein